jgi:hypothetical protein
MKKTFIGKFQKKQKCLETKKLHHSEFKANERRKDELQTSTSTIFLRQIAKFLKM